ncbi:MAG: KH domain-containing protein [Bacillales bacterium]|nr:KH domain-containing protein [Bacillales bacterium]
MDYIDAIQKFINPIVNFPEKVVIIELPNDNSKDRTFLITCEKDDAGRLIGKHGSTADALREVLSIAGKTNEERVHIKFASTEEIAE